MSHQGTDPGADARIGTMVGVYRVDSLLGVGGMGTVYEATAPDGTRVALKVVKEDYARDETFRRRFQREARIAQTVSNPHVVPVLDTGEHDGIPYLAERFVEGGSLEQKLKREGRLDLPTTVRICAQVAEGLEALWAAGMVHRDVKPGNILLDAAGTAYINGLRSRQGQPGQRPDDAGAGARIDGLHGARADSRRAGHRRHRHLRARMRHVRMRAGAHRSQIVRACGSCGRTCRTSLPTQPAATTFPRHSRRR